MLFIITPADDKCSTERAVQAVTDLAKQQPKKHLLGQSTAAFTKGTRDGHVTASSSLRWPPYGAGNASSGEDCCPGGGTLSAGSGAYLARGRVHCRDSRYITSFIRLGITVQGPIIDGDQEKFSGHCGGANSVYNLEGIRRLWQNLNPT